MESIKLNELEAYKVMLIFLDNLQKMVNSDDLAGFLGGFQVYENQGEVQTMDLAAWKDWQAALDEFNNRK